MFEKIVHCRTCGAPMARGAKACPNCGASPWGMSGLTRCKTCGGEVAKNANVCPHCGAKQNTWVYAVCGVILAVGVFVGVLAVREDLSKTKSPDRAMSTNEPPGQSQAVETPAEPEEEPPVPILATYLWSQYEENSVNADNLYKDKKLAVTGKIKDISQDILTENPCVVLDSGDSLGVYGIQCFFPDDESTRAAVAALRDGENVTIVGECIGISVVVQLTGCQLSS